MDTATLDRLRARLEDARDDDRARLAEQADDRPSGSAHETHPGGAGAANEPTAILQREEQASLREETERRLRDVELALERIDDGTYTQCEVCGTEIGDERLDAVPMTRRCIEHAVTEDDAA